MLETAFVAWFFILTVASALMEWSLSRCRKMSFRVITCGQLQALICCNTMIGGIMRLTNRGIDPYFIKYLEWTVAAPLIVLQTCVIANVDFVKLRTVVVQTVTYCIAGIVAANTSMVWLKVICVAGGTVLCMLVVLRLVYEGITKPGVPTVAGVQVVISIFTWPLYVAVWCAGPHCLNYVSSSVEASVEMILGAVMKTANMHVLIVDSERTVVFDLDSEVTKEG